MLAAGDGCDSIALVRPVGDGEHGVDVVALGSLEAVAVHTVLGLEVADDGFDSGASLHLAPDGGGDTAGLAGDPDPEFVLVIVAPVPLVDRDAAGLDAGELLGVGNDSAQGVPIVRVAVQCFDMEDELAALG
jgi:hypothetical protein